MFHNVWACYNVILGAAQWREWLLNLSPIFLLCPPDFQLHSPAVSYSLLCAIPSVSAASSSKTLAPLLPTPYARLCPINDKEN